MCHAVNVKMQSVTKELRRRCKVSGQSSVARQLGVSRSFLCHILAGRRQPGRKLLKALGLKYELTNGR